MSYSDFVKKYGKKGEDKTSPSSLPTLAPQNKPVVTKSPNVTYGQTLYNPNQIAKEEADIVADLQNRGKTVNNLNAKLAVPKLIGNLYSNLDAVDGGNKGYGMVPALINVLTAKDSAKLDKAKDLSLYTDAQLSDAYKQMPNQNILQRIDSNRSGLSTAKQLIQPTYDKTVRQNAYDTLTQKGLYDDFIKAFPVNYQNTLGINNLKKLTSDAIGTYDDKQRISQMTGIPVDELQNLADAVDREGKLSVAKIQGDKVPVLSSIVSVPKNLEGGIEGTAYSLGSLLSGSPVQSDNKAFINKEEASTIRDTVSEGIKNPVGKFAYKTGMSIADSVAAQALGGGKLGTVFMGMGAYADSIKQGAEKGLTPSQMQTTALASGAFEYLFEKISWDNIKLIAKGGTSKNVLANIGTQMLTEGSEEIGTELANNFVDNLVNGGASEMAQLHDFYVSQGMSDKDAQKETMRQFAIQLGMSGLGGAISGGVMGGGASLLNKVTTPKIPTLPSLEQPSFNTVNVENPNAKIPVLDPIVQKPVPSVEIPQGIPALPSLAPTTQNNNTTQNKIIPSLDNIANTNQVKTPNVLPDNVRGYNETLINKTDMPQEIKNEFIENPQIYDKLNNKETLAKAEAILNNLDTNTSVVEFNRLVDMKDPVSVPLGYNVAKQLQSEGRIDEAVEVIRKLSEKLTESGQFSQAAAITMMQNDPVTALKYVIREMDTLNQKGKEKFGDKWNDFELTESEKQIFSQLKPGDADGIKNAYGEIFNRIQKQYPSTFKEKLYELRRISMLLSVRTNVRNTVSNAMLMPVRWTSDRVSALGQSAAHLINPNFDKTQAVIVNKDSRKLAKEAWSTVADTLLGNNKYNDVKDATRDKQVFKGTVFSIGLDNITNGAITKLNKALGKDVNPSILESARNLTYWLLQKGDDAFVKKNFESRMASYISAQKINSLDSIPADAYTLATQEALKATFKDDTALSRMLANVKKDTGIIGEVVMPFTKTPANLAMRGYDYSIGGYVELVKSLAKKQVRTQADVSRVMDSISKSVVGTAAIAVGIALAKAGLITGPLSDDKDEAAFQRQQGMLPYAVKIGSNYYSYDWAQPVSIPIILGATIYNSMKESDTALNSVLQGGLAATNAWFDLSPLKGVKEIFGGYGTPAENIGNALLEFPLSFLPSQLGALARTTDTTQRSTYSNGNVLDTLKNSAISKIPGLSQTLPATYDTWGNEVNRSDSVGEAAFAQMLNPGQLGNANVTPIDSEITRLFEATGNNAVFPKKASWSYQINGQTVKLTNEQYSAFQQIMGKTAFEATEELITSEAYNNLTDAQKVNIVKSIYEFANAKAKNQVLGYNMANSDFARADAVYSDKGSEGLSTFLYIQKSLDGNSSTANKVNTINTLNLSDEDKGYYLNKFVDVSKSAQAIQGFYGDTGLYQWYNMRTMADYDGSGNVNSAEMTYQIIKSGMRYDDMLNYVSVLFEDSKEKTAREKAAAKITEVQDNFLYYKNKEYFIQMFGTGKTEETGNKAMQNIVPTQGTQEYNDLYKRNMEYFQSLGK